jgi:outer membrane protein assembly factor BamD (BamD/ComL family)
VARARALLRAGDAAGARSELARAETSFPNGVLAEEREALALAALVKLGDREGARARAAAFLQRYPESVHAAAARRALE